MDYDDWRSAHGVAEPSKGIKTVKLGEKLKQTLEELERAKIKSLEEQAAADMKKIRQERADAEIWLDRTQKELVDQIESGKVPLKKVKNYDRQRWLREANKNNAPNSDLWANFRQFWHSEGLDPVLEEAHDGMGMESWINLTLKIRPARPRSVDHGLKGDLGVGDYRG